MRSRKIFLSALAPDKTSSLTTIFPLKFLQAFDIKKGATAGVGAAIRNFGSSSGRQFNFGSSALSSATLNILINIF
jgi:hypothetical protein